MEIKPQELRLGNWVKWPDEKEPNEVQWEHGHWLGVFEKNYGYPYAIKLTPEWLERFGFHGLGEVGLWGIQNKYGEYLFQLQDNYLEIENSFSHIWDSSFTGAPIKYVHQLQNLYFALTGVELAIDKTSIKN